MELEQYMIQKIQEICQRAERENKVITKAVLSMVLAEVTEVVNDIRAKINGTLGFTPPMPSVSVKFANGRVCATVDTTNWVDQPEQEEKSEWDVDDEDEELDR